MNNLNIWSYAFSPKCIYFIFAADKYLVDNVTLQLSKKTQTSNSNQSPETELLTQFQILKWDEIEQLLSGDGQRAKKKQKENITKGLKDNLGVDCGCRYWNNHQSNINMTPVKEMKRTHKKSRHEIFRNWN